MQYTLSLLALAAGIEAQSLTTVLAGAKGLTGLTSVLGKYPEIVKTLGAAKDITIFAPKDGAKGLDILAAAAAGKGKFAPGTVEAALTYHVVKGVYPSTALPPKAFVETLLTAPAFSGVSGGQKLTVVKSAKGVSIPNGKIAANVVIADIKFDGGIIHVIDKVLQMPEPPSQVAIGAGLSALVKALNATQLVSAVDGAKDITIFAPTDAAFAKAQPILATLTPDQLSKALTFHVAKGAAYSTALKPTNQVSTLQGGPLTVTVGAAGVTVAGAKNSAKVVIPDVLVKNGVVHVIDSVLLPTL